MATVERINIFPIKSCHSIEVNECEVNSLGILYDRRFMIIDAATNRFISQRRYPSLVHLQPMIDTESNTLKVIAGNQMALSVPLLPAYESLSKKKVTLWKDTLTVYDMGDEASRWFTDFLLSNCDHGALMDKGEDNRNTLQEARLVILEDPKQGVYQRQSHPKLTDIHTPFTDDSPISFGFSSSLDALNKGLIQTDFSKNNQVPMGRFRNNITIAGTTPWEEDEWLVVRIGTVTCYVVQPIPRCPVTSIDQETGIKVEWDGRTVNDYLKIKRSFKDNTKEGHFCSHIIPLTRGKIQVGDKVEVLERIPKEYAQNPIPATVKLEYE
ncbi:MOSC N-terminal beta barrel domain-containing protein [Pilobolus umbonatus]|nr:MOSC N-terminal beta barrel domain-containing protein [Pilobolus umbonatus]